MAHEARTEVWERAEGVRGRRCTTAVGGGGIGGVVSVGIA